MNEDTGEAARSAGSPRETDARSTARFRLTDNRLRGQNPRYGFGLFKARVDLKKVV